MTNINFKILGKTIIKMNIFKQRPFRLLPSFEQGMFSERKQCDWLGYLILYGSDKWEKRKNKFKKI